MKRFRPWPQSLAGQLIALLLIALVVAQVLTLWLFAGERRVALVELARNTIVSRTVSLVRLVEDATETQRPEMLRAISSRFLWFWIDETPALGNTGKGKTDRRIAGMMTEELGAERDIRVDVSHRPPLREAPSRRRIDVGERDGDDDGRAEDDRRRGRDRWRDAPVGYGPHKTIYNRFIRWSRLGVFNRIFAELAAKGGKPDCLMIDATHLKAHRTAASPCSPKPTCWSNRLRNFRARA